MPFIIEPKNNPLYNKGWNEAEEKRNLKDALLVIKEFNLSIEEKFGLDTKFLLDN